MLVLPILAPPIASTSIILPEAAAQQLPSWQSHLSDHFPCLVHVPMADVAIAPKFTQQLVLVNPLVLFGIASF